MTGVKFILGLLCLTVCSAKPKLEEHWDSDGAHVYYMPSPDDPDAWRDWIDPPEQANQDWKALAQAELQNALNRVRNPIEKPARNVILFIGDGMGISTVSAARVYRAQSRQLKGDDAYLTMETLPHAGLSRTYIIDQQVPDSAPTATALLSGVKARNGIVGGTQDVIRFDCSSLAGNEAESVMTKAIREKGMVGGVISTSRVTHATPAATYAYSAEREWEADVDMPPEAAACTDLAAQLVREDRNKDIRVILGGGRQNFLTVNDSDPEYPTMKGRRNDSNLIEEWQQRRADAGWDAQQVALVYNQTDFDAVDPETTEYLMGLFEYSHMNFNADRDDPNFNTWAEPSLAEMVDKAIRILRKHDEGYFLLVEGGRIDSAHHDNLAMKAMNDTVALDDAVRRALEMTDEDDTLILTTADHSHVFTFAGYGANNHDILVYDKDGNPDGMMGMDNKPYMTLGYTNGPGYDFHRKDDQGNDVARRDVSQDFDSLPDKDYIYDAGIPLYSETHAGEDVGVWARGPMAHLIHSTHEQSYIGAVQMYALCVGDNKELCDDQPENPSGAASFSSSGAHWLLLLLPLLALLAPRY